MDNNIKPPQPQRNGRAIAGLILLGVGAVLLVRQFHFFFLPGWLFSWPVLLIFIGLYTGAKSNFHKPGSLIMILLGIVFLINDNVNGAEDIVWPVAIIVFGLWLILRRHNRFDTNNWKQSFRNDPDWANTAGRPAEAPAVDYTTVDYTAGAYTPPQDTHAKHEGNDDYLDTVSVFGSVKKIVLSKNFKGGEITNIFGGAELDFTQADINGRVFIDFTQLFGSTKLIVPPHWQVVPDIAAVFAGIDDKRMRSTASAGTEKVLVLKGVSIFAGVDIRSY